MNFSPFSCPIFLGHPEARGRCSQGERVLYGRDLCRSGGTGKAEAAKLPGAGTPSYFCASISATRNLIQVSSPPAQLDHAGATGLPALALDRKSTAGLR